MEFSKKVALATSGVLRAKERDEERRARIKKLKGSDLSAVKTQTYANPEGISTLTKEHIEKTIENLWVTGLADGSDGGGGDGAGFTMLTYAPGAKWTTTTGTTSPRRHGVLKNILNPVSPEEATLLIEVYQLSERLDKILSH